MKEEWHMRKNKLSPPLFMQEEHRLFPARQIYERTAQGKKKKNKLV